MFRQIVLAGAVLAALLLGPPAGAAEHPDPKVQAGITMLDEWIRSHVEYEGVGLVIGIVHDQDVVLLKAYGYSSLDPETPMREGSIFRIASHSKLFTAISVLRARDTGALRLDDEVATHLPWFDIENRHPKARPVTVRHLLTHTAGLPRESIHPAWTDFEFPEAEAVRDTISDQETTYPTETKWKYSNLGFTLAGMVAGAASGKPFAELVNQGILEPLGMDSTSVGPIPADHQGRLATGYGRRMADGSRMSMPFVDARAFDPATGVSSSVPDMLKFLQWQMRVRDRKSEEVLATNTLLEMQRVHWVQSFLGQRLGAWFFRAPYRGSRPHRPRRLLPRLPHPDATEPRGGRRRRGVHERGRRKSRTLLWTRRSSGSPRPWLTRKKRRRSPMNPPGTSTSAPTGTDGGTPAFYASRMNW